MTAPTTAPTSLTTTQTFNIGTRRSALALVQTDLVVAMLKKYWPQHEFKVHAISTMGDKNQVTALHDFGAKSLWTQELESMLMGREVDFIVHCLKDIPTQLPVTCTLGAILPREEPRDALILSPLLPATKTLATLSPGSVIGTSSVRRSAQLARLHPHLKFQSVRGNIGTRLSKLDAEGSPYSALILAAAGLLRMDWGHRITSLLDSSNTDGTRTNISTSGESITSNSSSTTPTTKARDDGTPIWGMLYAVGQGALALEVRRDDSDITTLIAPLNDRRTSLACLTERSLLRTLEGGCSVPIGVESEWIKDGKDLLTLRATVVSLNGTSAACASSTSLVSTPEEADEFGRVVARMLVERGADKILESINLNRDIIEAQKGA